MLSLPRPNALPWYQHLEDFELTNVLGNALLMFGPVGIIVLATPLFVKGLALTEHRIVPGRYLFMKLACGIALVAIQAMTIALQHNTEPFVSKLSEAAAAMSLVSSVGSLAIIIYALGQTLQTPPLLGVFLSLTTLFDIAVVRSHFLREGLRTATALQSCVVLLKFLFVTIHEIPNRVSYHLGRQPGSHAPAGFWNEAILLWLNPLFVFGWLNEFNIDDLPDFSDELTSEKLFDRFTPHWNKVDKSSTYALVIALLRTLKYQLALALLSRLCFVGCTVAQPYLLLYTVEAVTTGHIERTTSANLIGACAVIYFGLSATRSFHDHWGSRAITSARGILIAAIYDKMHRLSADDLANSDTITLMTADVKGVEDVFSLASEFFSSVIQLLPSIWVLCGFIGPAAFLIILPTLATFLASVTLNQTIENARAEWREETASRVMATSNLFAQLKSAKAMGLSGSLAAFLEAKFELELQAALRQRHTTLWVFAIGAINYTVTPAIVFAGACFWTRAANHMSVAEVFAIFAVLLISSQPLISLGISTSGGPGASFPCFTRIQAFLTRDELQDPRDCGAELTDDDEPLLPALNRNRKPFAIQLDDVSVTSHTGDSVIERVTLRVAWGSLTMMWGPIGCGKSTFLRLLLGEVKLDAGTVAIGSDKISYCSQDFWIQNCTARNAIIGCLEYIQSRYDDVVRACGLDLDFLSWPGGDQTATGTSGCNLSASQRQRISLARAAYARNEIMVIDDMFSRLDPTTAGIVFHNLFGENGLVRRWNCTVIMTTNRLELLDFANHVYQFTGDGHLERQDDFSSDGSSCFDSSTETSSGSTDTDATEIADAEPPLAALTKDDTLIKRKNDGKASDVSLYASFVSSAGFLAIVFWVVVAMTAALGEWMPAIYLRLWLAKSPNSPRLFIGYSMFSALSVALNVASGAFFFNFVLPSTSRELYRRLLRVVAGATPWYLEATDPGSLLTRFTHDLSAATGNLAMLANQAVYEIFTVLIEIGMISFGSHDKRLMAACLFISYCIVQVFYIRSSRQLQQLELGASSALIVHVTETSDGIHHIRSFGWQSQFLQRLHFEVNRSQKPRYLLWSVERWMTVSMDLISAIASVIVVRDSTLLTEDTSDVVVGLSMLCLIGFSGTTSRYIRKFAAFVVSLGVIRRIHSFIVSTPQEQDTLDGHELSKTWSSNGRIDFSSVTASYRIGDGTIHRALNDFTFTFRPGQRIGIMGRSESGKSTLLLSILRMVDYTGTISIDGRDIREIPHELLRSRITTITQEGLRLKATLRFNLYPYKGPQPSDHEMIGALQTVNLWAHVVTHGGLDAQYSLLGFSVNQRRFVFLARAILHQSMAMSRIVLIDGGTGDLSADAEESVQEIINNCFDQCTVLIVSHSLEALETADMILRFERGALNLVLRRRSNGELVEVQ